MEVSGLWTDDGIGNRLQIAKNLHISNNYDIVSFIHNPLTTTNTNEEDLQDNHEVLIQSWRNDSSILNA